MVSTRQDGVLIYNPTLESADLLVTGYPSTIRGLAYNKRGDVFFVSEEGLYQFDPSKREGKLYCNNPFDKFSISSDNLRCVFRDSEDRIWAGTYYTGADVLRVSIATSFRSDSSMGDRAIKGNTVRAICRDSGQNLWLGTEDGYLNKISPDGRVFTLGESNGVPAQANYHSIVAIKNRIFVATYDRGVYILDAMTDKVVKHQEFSTSHCICLLGTDEGGVYMGADDALMQYNADSEQFERVPLWTKTFVHSLCQDSSGNIWIGTYGRGVWLWNTTIGQCAKLKASDTSYNIQNLYVTHLFEDSKGRVWMATEGDGVCYAVKSGSGDYDVFSLNSSNGFPNDVACAIVEDNEGNILVSTNAGIVSLDGNDCSIRCQLFDNSERVGNYYRYGAVLKLHNDDIYWGATHGLLEFNASDLEYEQDSPVYITSVEAGNSDKSTELRQEGKSSILSESLRVAYKDAAYIKISYATTCDNEWSSPVYRYTIKRGDKVLRSETCDENVMLTGLTPGTYRFELSLLGSRSSRAQKQLKITIIPPFYLSSWAYVVYSLLILGVAVLIFIWFRKRENQNYEQKLLSLENEKQKEIYDAKINFFTNITHEIRTPLTLIKMPLDNMVDNNSFSKETREDIVTIRSNVNRLLELVNQLLDFRKMESQQMKLNFVKADICEILRRVLADFRLAVSANNIELESDIPEGPIMLMCAVQSIEKILNNLISNAVKYCVSKITVSLSEEGEKVVLRVFSDGGKIPRDKGRKIFEPFFQERASNIKINGSKGTGLGLAFAKTLVELHNGQIFLRDDSLSGNTFVMELPKVQEGYTLLSSKEIPDQVGEESESGISREEDGPGGKYVVLVVEDDKELNEYLRRLLAKEYTVVQSYNGAEAVELIKSQKVDLVVSDIMMPGLNGLELCKKIKGDKDYCHIPVLLLTAAVGMETRVQTLEVGADGYIEKPFSADLLLANISNLFTNREITFKQFTDSPLSHFNGMKSGNVDDEFISKVHTEVMRNISDPEFSVDALTAALGTSQSTLLRKVKAYTGLSVNEYIKISRLKRAAELLDSKKYRVNEVVYMVGFTSPSYFTALFKNQFNILPSDFMRRSEQKYKNSGK